MTSVHGSRLSALGVHRRMWDSSRNQMAQARSFMGSLMYCKSCFVHTCRYLWPGCYWRQTAQMACHLYKRDKALSRHCTHQ